MPVLSPRIWLVIGVIFAWALISLFIHRATRRARHRRVPVTRRQIIGLVADWIIVGLIAWLLFSGGYWPFALGVIGLWLGVYLLGFLFLGVMFFRRRRRRPTAGSS